MEGSAPLDDAELAQLLDSDELSALRICRSRFPLQTGLVPPIVLQHSLYSIIHDRAALDREVEKLRRNNTIRQFRLSASEAQQRAIVFTEDLIGHINSWSIAKGGSAERRWALERFMLLIQRVPHSLFIDKQELLDALYGNVSLSNIVTEKEAMLSILMQEGLLLRRDNTSFWFSIPNFAIFLTEIRKARAAVLDVLRRRPYQQCPYKTLVRRKLRKCRLDTEFVISDLLGMDAIQYASTGSSDRVLQITPS